MKLALHWQILIALVLAIIVGSLWPQAQIGSLPLLAVYDFVGTLFLNALKMIIVPLIVASIVTGMAGIGQNKSLGRLGSKTIVYYMLSSTLAILVGLILVNLITPGIIAGEPAAERLALLSSPEQLSGVMEKVGNPGSGDIAQIFLRLVPVNVIAAAAEGKMLGLIFFSLLFGYFSTKIAKKHFSTLRSFFEGLFETMMLITMFVLRFAPIGVFGLVAKTVSTTGFDAFLPLMKFFMTVVLALAVHTFIVLPLLLHFIGKVSVVKHFQAMGEALLTAFSTASSAATLPLSMRCVEKKSGVSNETTSFVLPLGATINMDGTALYECVAAIFIAQAYGIELSFATQFSIVLIALLTSIGVAGIPAASLVAILVILKAVGLPAEALGLLLVTDRILDMCRTAVNVFSDSCGAVIIARTEKEQTNIAR